MQEVATDIVVTCVKRSFLDEEERKDEQEVYRQNARENPGLTPFRKSRCSRNADYC